MRKSTLAASFLALGLSTTLTGCFGKFPLVRKTYEFNKSVSSNKFVQEAVFLVLNILPVYPLAGAADALVVNAVEFWTGAQLVSQTHSETRDGVTAESTVRPDGSLELTLTNTTGETSTTVLTRDPDGISAYSPEGEFMGKVAEASTGTLLIKPRAN
ncbi:MAG: DUF3332 family protein [Fibrobacteria bacterium]|nr:DUF3332 family protein [Fibrobacteria bacterium]